MHNYKELIVWQKSVDLATDVYRATSNFPKHELYGLTSQIRRCSVSISSNIAEGAGRSSSREFARFLKVANGSAYELETQLIISKNLSYLADESFEKLNQSIIEIQKMLYTFIKKIDN
ncbi:MAG: four helix bundle protein [Balneolaceae bacterium]|nr:four helix bundle protein [Balneolaceae bacterium]